MPRPKSGNPPWDAVAVKLPPWLIAEAERYADLYHISVSALLREGLIQRIQGQQVAESPYGITVIPDATLTVFARLADTLSTAAEELRKVCHPAREEGYNGYTSPVPTTQELFTERHVSGNTVIPRASEAEVDRARGQPATEKAAIVLRVRAMRDQGMSLAKIADQLQAEGIPTLSGKGRWQKGTIDKLLHGH